MGFITDVQVHVKCIIQVQICETFHLACLVNIQHAIFKENFCLKIRLKDLKLTRMNTKSLILNLTRSHLLLILHKF